ncbi:PD40 domain-containing protein [Alloacidobacterium dinghuense]|uniref:PD40 domain-containing protein n=1 Tax=Alloacidobacterium dinghuense TaxID=2763107 RepID=A0A7G8BDP5_9BACT|nr:winged helix-turn-helix domain-containing protein [Alloacidobacterium dinghuense]QNI30665.1 PD40 domain-containing protein [Alloacidobacterium dinghuense]
MSTAAKTGSKVHFGLFEADLRTGELYRSGIRVRLQAQPFRVLSILLLNAGEVVSREEFQERLWGKNTVVDFEHGLGTAINKIRDALGDSAENPRFIETLAKRGYRFISPVSFAPPQAAHVPLPERLPQAETPLQTEKKARSSVPGWLVLSICGLAGIAVGVGVFWAVSRTQVPSLQISRVTSSGRVSPGDTFLEDLPVTVTDGVRVYFPELENGRITLAQALIANGKTSTLTLPDEIVAPLLGDISPDGSKLLIRNHISAEAEQALWIVPTLGGAARQVSGVLAHDATWMPDGAHILYANGDGLWLVGENGESPQRLATLHGRAFWMRWAPNGNSLRLTLLNSDTHTTSLWELGSHGENPHQLLAGWNITASECCGSWTADGKYFVFQSRHNGSNNIWMLRAQSGSPVQLTFGPLDYQAPITSRSGNRIFFIGTDTRSELMEYSPPSKSFLPFGERLRTANRVAFSRDGKWMAWISTGDNSLWRSRIDGSEQVQLTTSPMEVFMMQWSSDSSELAFMAREPGKVWQVFLIGSDGGNLHRLLHEDRNEADPDWSPDGREIVFGRVPALMGETAESKAISLVDVASGKVTTIPGSQGLFSPRWSPDGRYIAALSLDMMRVMLYDTTTQSWRLLCQQSAADPVWATDSKSLFFHTYVQRSQAIFRVTVPDGKLEHVTDLSDLHFADVLGYQFAGNTPSNAPLVNASMSTANIYSTYIRERELFAAPGAH